MKPRARRVTIGAAALVAVLVAVVVATHLGSVRDHVEAWWFQLTRRTVTIDPASALGRPFSAINLDAVQDPLQVSIKYRVEDVLLFIAELSRRPVITTAEGLDFLVNNSRRGDATTANVKKVLEDNGFRFLEQRFPRKAYIVVRETR